MFVLQTKLITLLSRLYTKLQILANNLSIVFCSIMYPVMKNTTKYSLYTPFATIFTPIVSSVAAMIMLVASQIIEYSLIFDTTILGCTILSITPAKIPSKHSISAAFN
jgi:hypothetical protein